jgi:hypothetical protein
MFNFRFPSLAASVLPLGDVAKKYAKNIRLIQVPKTQNQL